MKSSLCISKYGGQNLARWCSCLWSLDEFHLLLSTQLIANLTLEWSSGSMFHPLWHIYTKNFILLRWNSCKQCTELSRRCCFWSTMCKRDTNFEHSFLIDKCSCKMVNTLPSDIFNSSAILWNFNLWKAKTILRSFLFSKTTAWFGRLERSALFVFLLPPLLLLVSIPPLNRCFWWSRLRITLIKPLLYLNSIYSHQKTMLYQHTKFRFFHCFENLQQ